MSMRRGRGWRGYERFERLTFCTCLRKPAQARRNKDPKDPGRPSQQAAEARMVPSCSLLPFPAAAKAAPKFTWMQQTRGSSRKASVATASKRPRTRAGSMRPPHQACTAAGAGGLPKLAARASPGGRGGSSGGGRTQRRHAPRKSAPTTLKSRCYRHVHN